MYVGERCSIVTCSARLRHARHERDGGGAAADDHDALAGVVEVVGPVLRVHEAALEVVGAGNRGRVPLVVAVVAGADRQEGAGEGDRLAILRRRLGGTRRRRCVTAVTVQMAVALDQ